LLSTLARTGRFPRLPLLVGRHGSDSGSGRLRQVKCRCSFGIGDDGRALTRKSGPWSCGLSALSQTRIAQRTPRAKAAEGAEPPSDHRPAIGHRGLGGFRSEPGSGVGTTTEFAAPAKDHRRGFPGMTMAAGHRHSASDSLGGGSARAPTGKHDGRDGRLGVPICC